MLSDLLGGRALQEGARLLVHRPSKEIVLRGVADVEFDRWTEFHEFDEVRLPERTRLFWWLLATSEGCSEQRATNDGGSMDGSDHRLKLILSGESQVNTEATWT